MWITLPATGGLRLQVDKIVGYRPNPSGPGSLIDVLGGDTIAAKEEPQAIDSLIKGAANDGGEGHISRPMIGVMNIATGGDVMQCLMYPNSDEGARLSAEQFRNMIRERCAGPPEEEKVYQALTKGSFEYMGGEVIRFSCDVVGV